MLQPVAPVAPWLGQVIPAAVAAISDRPAPAEIFVPQARSAIVILVDGLGWELLQQYRGHARVLRRFLTDAQVLETSLPSTTAAALTSFATGALPGRTNMVGYSVRSGESTMNLLHFAPDIDVHEWQSVPTFFSELQDSDIAPVVVTAPKFAGSGLTTAAFRGARFVGRLTLAQRLSAAREIAEASPSLVYVYWSEIDHVGHGLGPGSPEWIEELEFFDRELEVFLRSVPKDTTVLLTGDHGMVRVEQRVDIRETPKLSQGVRLLAGEGRAVHVHAEPGRGQEVRDNWSDYFGDRAVVVEPADYSKVIGDGPGTSLIGDALVFPHDPFVIVDSRTHSPAMIAQQGVHGSFTAQEVLVPLLTLAAP